MNTILISADGSARSEDALAFGRRLASASGARVLATCAPHDAHALHDVAHAEHAAIAVVGSPHTGRLGRVVPHATAERLLHGSPCAVAVVPSGYRTRPDEPIRRIGVATDGSPESLAAVAAAADLARALGAQLEVISVVSADTYGAPAMMGGPGYNVLRQDIERRQRESLASAVAALPPGTDAEAVPLAGNPARTLIEHSAGLDLLIVGSRGYGPLRAVLLGSVSGPVVRGAHCPVIALPRGAEAPLGELFAAEVAAT